MATTTEHANHRDPTGEVAHAVRSLNPGYFALVMASGILSVGMYNRHQVVLSDVLLGVAVASYAVLIVLHAWRIAAYRVHVVADFTDPRRGFGFLTFVAGTDVLGTRFTIAGDRDAAFALLLVGGVSWLVLGYVLPWTAVLGHSHRPIIALANGTWFIWAVASESVAVLAAALEPATGLDGRHGLALLAVFAWSVGVFLYAAAGIFVGARLMLYPLSAADLTPAYWVAMGATAITVLAGARIVEMADDPMIAATRGLIAGASVVFWAFGSWLIPVLVASGWWRHRVRHVPLRYEAALWSMVFPLGMYGAAGYYIGRADSLPIVHAIGSDETWVAAAVWLIVFVSMLVHLYRTLIAPSRPRVPEPPLPLPG